MAIRRLGLDSDPYRIDYQHIDFRYGGGCLPATARQGMVILVSGLVCEAAAFGGRWALLNDALADQPALRKGASVDAYPSLWWLAPGLLVLAFAELVRRGSYLRAELDQVI